MRFLRSGWRSVVNEQKLIAALQPLGFRSVFLEDMSLMQQIQLFQQSDFVVGPHGSGLVNLAYCNPGTLVLEFETPVRPNILFHIIAHHRKLRYKNFFGRAEERKVTNRASMSMYVDCWKRLLFLEPQAG